MNEAVLSPSRTSRHRRLWLFLAALPALAPLILILRYGVDFHYFDEWTPDMAGVFIKAHAHQLTLGDILAQHNEHRPATTRLILLATNPITHWNNVDDLVVGWLLVVTASLLVWGLIRRTQTGGGGIFLWFLCNLLLFTPAQNENWLWGMGMANFTPAVFILATFLAAQSRLWIWVRLIFCAALASLATISIGNGILAWPLGGLILVWPHAREPWSKKKWMALVWVIVGAAAILLYQHGYREPEHHGHPYVRTPGAVLTYTLAYMGNIPPLGDFPGEMDRMVFGGVMCLGALASGICFLYLVRAGRRELCGRMLPWLMVAGYGILSGLIAAFYRAEFGPGQAVSSRYVTYSIYLPIALVVLASIIGDEVRQRAPQRWSRRWRRGAVAGATILILLQMMTFPRAIFDSAHRQQNSRLGKGALLLLNIVPANPQIAYFGPLPLDQLVGTVNELNEMGYVHPPLIASNDADLILRRESDDRRDISGEMDGFSKSPGGLMYVGGWAIYQHLDRPADSVFITYRDAGGHPIIFAAARMRLPRTDLGVMLPADELHDCGWEAALDPSLIPADIHNLRLSAWALDVDTGEATPLRGVVAVQR